MKPLERFVLKLLLLGLKILAWWNGRRLINRYGVPKDKIYDQEYLKKQLKVMP